ncbi:MAG: hypothetical protein EOO43_24430 [Flavobacterium sp.]|nr:MAG: hypothetical protein EOO43_24430 [Flavobacterium sp.]
MIGKLLLTYKTYSAFNNTSKGKSYFPFYISAICYLSILYNYAVPATYYFFISWIYLTGRWNNFELPVISVSRPYFFQTTWSYIAIALILITVVIGIYFIQANLRRQLVHTRKNWSLILVYLPVAFFVPFININDRVDYWVLVAVPVAIICGAAFLYPTRKLFAVSMHWAMVALVVIMGYFDSL